jgi:hypothetical protein
MLSSIEVNNRQSVIDWENSKSNAALSSISPTLHDLNADDATVYIIMSKHCY